MAFKLFALFCFIAYFDVLHN